MTLFKWVPIAPKSRNCSIYESGRLPLRLTIIGVLLCAAAPAAAQQPSSAWPLKAITLIVPAPPAGGLDILARTLQPGLAAELGQPVVVENKPGAGLMIGAAFVARSAPDGYTLLIGNSATQAINVSLYKKIEYDPVKDFAPITVAVKINFLVVVSAKSPFKSMQDLIAYAKGNPGKVFYGSAGTGTPPHLGGEMLKSIAGIDIVHVPYKGLGAATVSLLGGEITMIVGDEPTFIGQIRGGAVRALAVAGLERSTLLPSLPTVAEGGVPGYDVSSWQAVLAPAGTPRTVINRLHGAVLKVMATPAVKASFLAAGSIRVGNTPEEFAAFIQTETVKWATIIKASGATAD